MRLITGILAVIALLLSLPAKAEVPTLDPNRTVAVVGPIQNGNILPLGIQLIQWVQKDAGTPVSIIIDSPGGDVTTGFLFINQMEMVKSMGGTINCFVPGMAASMAFSVLTHCSNRYALGHSFLLWHRVRVALGGNPFEGPAIVTAPVADALARDLQRLDSLVLQETKAAMADLSSDVIEYHFEHETLHVASQLAAAAPEFLTAADSFPGFIACISNPKLPKPKKDAQDTLKVGQIIYIYTGHVGAKK